MQLLKNQVCRIKTSGLSVLAYAHLLEQLGSGLVTLSDREHIIIERVCPACEIGKKFVGWEAAKIREGI